ncbi:MAG: SUMF1/EgtB/PvdO family nonheme iron enzyme [Pirellulales bacterium]
MPKTRFVWTVEGGTASLELALVLGRQRHPFDFGAPPATRPMFVNDFLIGSTTVTESLWASIMRDQGQPEVRPSSNLPVVDVSWDEIVRPGGFLDRLNNSSSRGQVEAALGHPSGHFRLPTEVEWEYAARGGRDWSDGYQFSGSDDIDSVAWYDRKHGDHRQPVALKQPNQLGLFDMSGNVWEWCQDVYTPDVSLIPTDGTAYTGPGDERVLRGGCFHNGKIHCTVSKRYEIGSQYHDECIGMRLAYDLNASRRA